MLYRDAFGFVVKDGDNFNIMCGEFVITIINNDNVSITQFKPSSNVPQVYTVSSVQELNQINAVDGSMAILTMTVYKEARFNDIIQIPENLWGKLYRNVTLTSVPYLCHRIVWYDTIIFFDDGSGFSLENSITGDSYDDAYYEGEWIEGNQSFYFNDWGGPLLEFATENGTIIELSQANPPTASTLFIRENGEWVSKYALV